MFAWKPRKTRHYITKIAASTIAVAVIYSMLMGSAGAQIITFFSIFGGSSIDRGLFIASDGTYIYITGHTLSFSSPTERDALLSVFHGTTNAHLCSVRIDLGPSTEEDIGYFVDVKVVGGTTNIFVIGKTVAGPNPDNVFIARFTFDGTCTSLLSPAIAVYDLGGDEEVRGGAIGDTVGYVTGYVTGSGSFLLQFDLSTLDANWARGFAVSSGDRAFAATILDGNVFVTGQTSGHDVFVSKFDADGNHLATAIYSSPQFDEASFIITDGTALFVTGSVNVPSMDRDALVMKLGPDLSVSWATAVGTDAFEAARGPTIWNGKVAFVGLGKKFDPDADYLIAAVSQDTGDLSFAIALAAGNVQEGFGAATHDNCIASTGFTRGTLTTNLLAYPAVKTSLTYSPTSVPVTPSVLTPGLVAVTPTVASISPVFYSPVNDDVVYFRLCPNAMTFATTTTITETTTTTETTTATETTTSTVTATETTMTTATVTATMTSTVVRTRTEFVDLTRIVTATETRRTTQTITDYTTSTSTITGTIYLTTTFTTLTTQTRSTTTTYLTTSTSVVESTTTSTVTVEKAIEPQMLPLFVLFILVGLALGMLLSRLLRRR